MIIKSVNLAIRFLLELCALISLGYWGFHVGSNVYTKFLFGIGSPLLLALLWGTFISPKASFKLPEPYRFILELIIFAVASSALYIADKTILAILIGMIFVINRILLIIWKQ
ncbi:YrdB family protein [Bacillus sp. EAC]|uniref:YrdB family protein n=1 Tax=Bacillus sp. EAC TaxID=1978338 RepID=UPI000B45359E|nr:YrdB family protein [Bacillus sp. EAC]